MKDRSPYLKGRETIGKVPVITPKFLSLALFSKRPSHLEATDV